MIKNMVCTLVRNSKGANWSEATSEAALKRSRRGRWSAPTFLGFCLLTLTGIKCVFRQKFIQSQKGMKTTALTSISHNSPWRWTSGVVPQTQNSPESQAKNPSNEIWGLLLREMSVRKFYISPRVLWVGLGGGKGTIPLEGREKKGAAKTRVTLFDRTVAAVWRRRGQLLNKRVSGWNKRTFSTPRCRVTW